MATSYDTEYFTVTCTYVFKSVFTQLRKQMEESQQSEPRCPPHHLVHFLHIEHTKNKYKLVENKVPKPVLDLLKNNSIDNEVTKQSLYGTTEMRMTLGMLK